VPTRLASLGLLLFLGTVSTAFSQARNDFIQLFGDIIQSPRAQTARREWTEVPSVEVRCVNDALRQQGGGVDAPIQLGVMPSDPRLKDARSTCRTLLAQLPSKTSIGQSSTYSVAGLSLGTRLRSDSAEYREYTCRPSDQFEGFTWCQMSHQERERRGSFTATYSILHSRDGTIVYVNRFQQPAFFAPTEAEEDVQRYSRKNGQPSRIIKMPSRQGFREGMIAYWGNLVLEPVTGDGIRILAEGKSPKQGLLIDFIGDFTRSAKEGLPIYRITGGPGFVWAASYDQAGKGTLRFAAADASAYRSGPASPDIQERGPRDQAAWRQLVRLQLERHKNYPAKSISRGEEGVVKLKFRVDRNGNVLASSIVESSGFPDLDMEVLGLIQRVQPLPAFPPEMSQDSVEVFVPVRFRVKHSQVDAPLVAQSGVSSTLVGNSLSALAKETQLKAERGLPAAQYELAMMYAGGAAGLPNDDGQAASWFRKAADQGHAAAQKMLGDFYIKGRGVAENETEAFRWMKMSAEQGNADAQYSVGLLFEKGAGTPKDDSHAYEWYKKAAERGISAAQGKLKDATSAIERVRAASLFIQDRLSAIRSADERKRGILARLVAVNETSSLATLRDLDRESQIGRQIVTSAEEFSRVSDIANQRILDIQTELDKVTSDAPIIQELRAAIQSTNSARPGTNLRVLQEALSRLNHLYDSNKDTIRRLQFYSP
jgi:TonB family protein